MANTQTTTAAQTVTQQNNNNTTTTAQQAKTVQVTQNVQSDKNSYDLNATQWKQYQDAQTKIGNAADKYGPDYWAWANNVNGKGGGAAPSRGTYVGNSFTPTLKQVAVTQTTESPKTVQTTTPIQQATIANTTAVNTAAASSTTTYVYNIDAQLKSVYSQYQKAGGKSLDAPKTYGNFTDKAQAQKILDEYTAKANSSLKSTGTSSTTKTATASSTTTYVYNIDTQLKSVYSQYQKLGGKSLDAPKTYGNFTDKAQAQKILTAYETAANSSLQSQANAKINLYTEMQSIYDQLKKDGVTDAKTPQKFMQNVRSYQKKNN